MGRPSRRPEEGDQQEHGQDTQPLPPLRLRVKPGVRAILGVFSVGVWRMLVGSSGSISATRPLALTSTSPEQPAHALPHVVFPVPAVFSASAGARSSDLSMRCCKGLGCPASDQASVSALRCGWSGAASCGRPASERPPSERGCVHLGRSDSPRGTEDSTDAGDVTETGRRLATSPGGDWRGGDGRGGDGRDGEGRGGAVTGGEVTGGAGS